MSGYVMGGSSRFRDALNFQKGMLVEYNTRVPARVQKRMSQNKYKIMYEFDGKPVSAVVDRSKLKPIGEGASPRPMAVNSERNFRLDPVTLERYPLHRQIKLGDSYHDVRSILTQLWHGNTRHPLRRTPFTKAEVRRIIHTTERARKYEEENRILADRATRAASRK
jgi:hypothetical protein